MKNRLIIVWHGKGQYGQYGSGESGEWKALSFLRDMSCGHNICVGNRWFRWGTVFSELYLWLLNSLYLLQPVIE